MRLGNRRPENRPLLPPGAARLDRRSLVCEWTCDLSRVKNEEPEDPEDGSKP
jgi:hypothetical protein